MKRPLIGITGNILIMEGGMFPGFYRAYVNQDYIDSVLQCGGVPVILPVAQDPEIVKQQVEQVDGVILSGGYDIDPQLYAEDPIPKQGFNFRAVDDFYLTVIKESDRLCKPLLGICKGLQALNVAFGGTLYQDLVSQKEGALRHVQEAPRQNGTHKVRVEAGSFLASCLPSELTVNSYHHQAVRNVAKGFRVTATAADGVVEAMEKETGSFMVGVQWHPEMMSAFGNSTMNDLFKKFLEKISDRRA